MLQLNRRNVLHLGEEPPYVLARHAGKLRIHCQKIPPQLQAAVEVLERGEAHIPKCQKAETWCQISAQHNSFMELLVWRPHQGTLTPPLTAAQTAQAAHDTLAATGTQSTVNSFWSRLRLRKDS
jgi:hypothetical protein